MNQPMFRKVLDCASPLALSIRGLAFLKRQRTGALQDADATTEALIRSWPRCAFNVGPRSFARTPARLTGLLFVALAVSGTAAEVNYDEAKVGSFTLPDPLRMQDGRSVTNAAMWHRFRRPEILGLFQQEVYGKPPPRPSKERFRVVQEDRNALEGRATRRDVEVDVTAATNGTAVRFTLFLPNHAPKPVPVFVGIHVFDTLHAHPRPAVARLIPGTPKPAPDEKARIGEATADRILARGYGLVSLNIEHLAPDSATNYWQGVARLFGRTQPGPPQSTETGALGLWAWGLSRAMDYFESAPDVDARRVIVIGHSRMGKTALWAAANDERFAAVISNNSGCGGAALSRRNFGETVAIITRVFPHWFCGNFAQYAGNESRLPVDQHELVALIAPRPVYVASAVEDRWADPRGEFLAALHAEPVYRLLNAGGLGVTQLPPPDQPVGETIRYHLRHGQHDLTDYDWEQYLDFADRCVGRSAP